ncbi:MAG: aquaporin family protein [Gammaproteobacteria bacterium TMED95]|jgi:glycerol uptake facilitator-like aquaporin|nr:aquaporin family protein [Gammaproteobacteria bacterium]OUV19406.1 MAG: aquaporin family protein [Gammaproteobacteria bacterium TMED95]|tara:strand:- start:77 stop:727 length:651 start_codon:yes stop_codon:yes gene_type:complete
MAKKLIAEALGTFLLLATVVGSGIMGETLAAGNTAVALLGNTLATGALLVVLITIFGPISGAHFNPAVTCAMLIQRRITTQEAGYYIVIQVAAGLLGVLAAHFMFDQGLLQVSEKARYGTGQWFSEALATFGLVLTILGTVKYKPDFVAVAVGLYITGAYWFTASTSFANPAVTIARGFTDTFSGIDPNHVPIFILMQLLGAVLATLTAKFLFEND